MQVQRCSGRVKAQQRVHQAQHPLALATRCGGLVGGRRRVGAREAGGRRRLGGGEAFERALLGQALQAVHADHLLGGVAGFCPRLHTRKGRHRGAAWCALVVRVPACSMTGSCSTRLVRGRRSSIAGGGCRLRCGFFFQGPQACGQVRVVCLGGRLRPAHSRRGPAE